MPFLDRKRDDGSSVIPQQHRFDRRTYHEQSRRKHGTLLHVRSNTTKKTNTKTTEQVAEMGNTSQRGDHSAKSSTKPKNPLLNEDLFIANPETLAKFNNFDVTNANERIVKALSQPDSPSLDLNRALLNNLFELRELYGDNTPQHRLLHTLDLSFNFLTELPLRLTSSSDETGDEKKQNGFELFNLGSAYTLSLCQLQVLNLRNNKLNGLDGTLFSHLPNLKELNLYWNNLIELPESLFSCTQLQILNLGRNKLVSLPNAINQLNELKTLNISFNMINELPELTGLIKLEEFYMYRYPGSSTENTQIPSFNGLPFLKKIQLRCLGANDITHFLDQSSSSGTIEEIDLSFNAFGVLPECNRFANVTLLRLCSCNLSQLPESFSALTNLKKLYLRANKFSTIPHVVLQLVQLEELDFCLNALTSIDPRIAQLVNLERLGLAMNKLTVLPKELSHLGKLTVLRLEKNDITTPSKDVVDKGLSAIMKELKGNSDDASAHRNVTIVLDSENLLLNRLKGCLFGQCIGDAMGLATEFMDKQEALAMYGVESFNPETFYMDGHRGRWVSGDFTDDSDQMLLILDSIIDKKEPDYKDFANRLFRWIYKGYEVLGDNGGLGLGKTVKTVVTHSYYLRQDPHLASKDVWERSNKQLAANGAVMRTCILGILNYSDMTQVIDQTIQYAKVTHYDPRCIASCIAITAFIAQILASNITQIDRGTIDNFIQQSYDLTVSEYLRNDKYTGEYNDPQRLQDIEVELKKYMFTDSFSDLQLDEPIAIGYTFKSMGSAFTSLRQTGDIESILNDLVMESGDADSNACVAGAVLGCVYGYDKLPTRWIDMMPHKNWLSEKIDSFSKLVL